MFFLFLATQQRRRIMDIDVQACLATDDLKAYAATIGKDVKEVRNCLLQLYKYCAG